MKRNTRRVLVGILIASTLAAAVIIGVPSARRQLLVMMGARTNAEAALNSDFCEAYIPPTLPMKNMTDIHKSWTVEPGQSIEEVATQAGPDAVIVIRAGIHRSQSVRPLRGQMFVGEPGALLDGSGEAYAFRSGEESVRISGLEITNYRPIRHTAVVHAEDGATSWAVERNFVHDNGETGIAIRGQGLVAENIVLRNGRYGVTGAGPGILVDSNEIACNAIDYGPTGDSGGTKFVYTANLELRQNRVHHNFGNGLWVDINNRNSLVVDNELEKNDLAGVFVEISCGATVRGNYLSGNGNGSRRPRTMDDAAILVSNSPDVEVTDNVLVDNTKGIGAIQWEHPNRDAVDRCEPTLRSLWVHGNSVRQERGLVAGIEATVNQDEVWSSWGNVFDANDYQIGPDARFRWEDETLGLDEWTEPMGSS
jgi:hypothetical protein